MSLITQAIALGAEIQRVVLCIIYDLKLTHLAKTKKNGAQAAAKNDSWLQQVWGVTQAADGNWAMRGLEVEQLCSTKRTEMPEFTCSTGNHLVVVVVQQNVVRTSQFWYWLDRILFMFMFHSFRIKLWFY